MSAPQQIIALLIKKMFAMMEFAWWTFVHKILLLISVYMVMSLKVPPLEQDNDDDHLSNYIILETLGEGAFGKVVRCQKNGETYAMKIQEKIGTEFLEDEVRVLRTIGNNYTCVKTVSIFDDDTRHYIVFEKLYKSLYQIISSDLLKDADIVSVTKQTLEALLYLHSKNIIHGDIKPENIMFTNILCKKIKLIDFGLSTFDESTKKTNTIATAPYRCPESIFNLIWSFGVDIWALGCVICEMKTGKLFFDSGDHCEEEPNDDAKQRHLSQIERVCGPFTKQMVRKCPQMFTEEGRCGSQFMSDESKQILKKQMMIKEVFANNEDMANLVKKMLTIDPCRRISVAGAMRHKLKEPFDAASADIRI